MFCHERPETLIGLFPLCGSLLSPNIVLHIDVNLIVSILNTMKAGLIRHPMVFIFLNLFDLLEFLVMLMTLILVIRF